MRLLRSAGRDSRRHSHVGHDPDPALRPAIGALLAVERDLREDRIDLAWIDLDIAAKRLAHQSSQGDRPLPALERALGSLERARDMLGRAQMAQAMAAIAGALTALTG